MRGTALMVAASAPTAPVGCARPRAWMPAAAGTTEAPARHGAPAGTAVQTSPAPTSSLAVRHGHPRWPVSASTTCSLRGARWPFRAAPRGGGPVRVEQHGITIAGRE